MLQRYPIFVLKNSISRRIRNVQDLHFSTIPAAGKQSIDKIFEQHLNDLEGLTSVFPRKRVLLPQKPPFAKNFFLGKLDTDLLTYPQLPKENVDELENLISILSKVSKQQQPKNVREALKILTNQKCLGLQCPINIGGRELNQTEQCMFNEVLLNNNFKFSLVNNELSISALLKYGTDEQKHKYLQKLLDGSILSTVCMGENNFASSSSASKTTAVVTNDLKSFILNGKKSHVISGKQSDFYIVFAQMEDNVKGSLQEYDITAFIVDSTLPGITLKENGSEDPNLKGMSDIIFENTLVSKENILGTERIGREILTEILPNYHLNFSIMSLNILKKLSTHLSQSILDKSPPGEELYKTDAVTSKMGEILTYTYIVESIIYLTSGLMSTYENQDCELETIITKVLSAELALKATEIGFSLSGVPSTESRHFCQGLHKEALSLYTAYEHENMVRILVGLLGLQYSGRYLGDTVKKLRNPLFHGSFILKRLLQDRRQHDDNPKLTLQLKNHLHLSCQDSANKLEYCVLRLHYVTEILFTRYGSDILNKHSHIRHLANIAIYIYAMTACLSRASRSYCIGLQHSDLEILISSIVCQEGCDIVKKNVDHILYEFDTPDRSWTTLSENLYKKKEYYFTHPLTRNF